VSEENKLNKVESFLNLFSSKATKKTYRWAVAEYFKSIYGDDELPLEERADQYFAEARNCDEDIQKFFSTITAKPPKTVRLMISAVRSFLIENDVELSEKFQRRLIRRAHARGTRALTLDKIPSNVELRRVISHMPIQGKALFLTMASSGMRIGETLKLQVDDVELYETPVKVNIRGNHTKTGNSRIAFLSQEAKEAIEEWVKVRSSYLQAASLKSKFKKSAEDSRLFPFESNTALSIWNNAVRKAGWLKKDSSTNRNTLHPHVLRKYFRTKMGAIIPVDITEALMGHEGYLTEVYRRYSPEDLGKFYLKGESALSIFTEGEELSKLKTDIDESNKTFQTISKGFIAENIELKERVKNLESHQRTVDHVLELLDLKEEDAKVISEMIMEYRERKRLKGEAEASASDLQ
jgi:integrase